MYQDLYEYIKKDREERRSHLDLCEECIEIGGDSRIFRGLLQRTSNKGQSSKISKKMELY